MINNLLKYAKEIGFENFQIIFTDEKVLSLKYVDSKLEENEVSKNGSYSFKGLINGKAVYASSEADNEEDLKKIIDQMLINEKMITIEEPELLFKGDKKYPKVKEHHFDFSKIKFENKINLLKNLENEVKKAKHLFKIVGCFYQETFTEYKIVNSLGLNLSKKFSYAVCYPYLVLKNGDDIVEDYELGFAYDFKKLDYKKIAALAINKATKQLGAVKEFESKSCPVILDGKVVASLLSVFQSSFKSTARYANKTRLKDLLNQKIASNLITIIDNPLYKDAIVQDSFDDEGVATYPKTIVEKGIFKMFLNNLKMAKIYNEKPTGSDANISCKNFYIENGKSKIEELYKKVNNGLLILSLTGFHAGVDQLSGDFSLQARGAIIKDGKLDKPIRMIVLSGNFFDMLNNVELVANDLEFVPDKMNFASPSILFNNLVVAGDSKKR